MSNEVPAEWYPELVQYVMNVITNGPHRDTQLHGDFSIGRTFGNRPKHFTLPRSQALPRLTSVISWHF